MSARSSIHPDLVREMTKLRQSLRRVEVVVADKAAPAAVQAAAAVLQAAVVREAPRDTGFMASQVVIVTEDSGTGSIVLLVQIGDEDFVGKTFYAAMVEYGTVNMPANGFMRRAIDIDGATAIDAARRAFASSLRDELGR